LLIFFLFSLIGVPFTGGFFGKFYSFTSAMDGGAVWLVLIGLLNSGLAAAYYLRLVLAAAEKPAAGVQGLPPAPRMGPAAALALGIAALVTLALGIYPKPALRAAWDAQHTLQAPPDQPGASSLDTGNAALTPPRP
jgi:NADH-quinone oxidoreductase subunit N